MESFALTTSTGSEGGIVGRYRPRRRVREQLPAALLSCLVTAVLLVALPGTAPAATLGTPLTFGTNTFGQFGDGSATTAQRTTPGAVTGLSDVVKVAGGREHVLALRSDGTVMAWGHNDKGQVGDGTTTAIRGEPVSVAGLANVKDIGTGHYHSLAVRTDGTVWVWGFNSLGQLGDGTTTNRTRPQRFGTFTTAVQAVGGRDMSYVRLADGTVWCAGSNTAGECGDGTTVQRRTPVQVSTVSTAVDVAGGRNHGLALDDTGHVWGWGLNDSGQVGDGTTTSRTAPQEIAGLTGVVDVAAGADHSVAVRDDGTVWTWGENFRGELGLGDTADRSAPTRVPGISDAVAADCGRDHTIVITATGSVYLWGWNAYGQSGSPTLTNVLSPRLMPGLTGVTSAAGGQAYTVVLQANGGGDPNPPSAPGTPTGSSPAPGTVDLTWAAATDDVASTLTYTVRRTEGATSTVVGTVTSAQASVDFTDTTAPEGATVEYDVRASDGVNAGPWSPRSDPITVAATPPPTTVWSEGFSNGLSAWTQVTRLTVDSTRGATAPPSVRGAVASQTSMATRTLPTPLTQACVTAAAQVETQTGTATLLRLRTAAGTSVARLLVGADRRLRVRSDVAGVTRTTSLTLPLGSWRTVGLCVEVAGANGTLVATSAGVATTPFVLNTGTTALGRVQIGPSAAATLTYNLDDVVVTTA